jgi:hypothetical protein
LTSPIQNYYVSGVCWAILLILSVIGCDGLVVYYSTPKENRRSFWFRESP